MQKKFLSNLLLLLLVNVIIKPLTIFGVDIEVQNRMGTEAYGLYFTFFNFACLFNILLDLGINNFTTKHVAQFPHVLKKYIGVTLVLRFVLSLIYIVLLLVIALVIGYKPAMLPIILLFGLQQICFTFITYCRSYLSGLLLFKQDALLSIIDKFLVLISCGTLLYAGFDFQFSIENYIGIQLISNLVAVSIAGTLLLRQVGKPKFNFNKPFFFYLIRESLPYALFIVLMMLYTRLDSVMVERLHVNGSYEAGLYAQGFRLVDAGFMFAMLFGSLLLPLFSKLHKDKEETIGLLKTSSKLLIWGAVGIVAWVYFYGEDMMHFLYRDVQNDNGFLLKIQFFTFIVMCASVIYGTFLTARGEMRRLNQIGIIGLAINIILNLILIPKQGAVGAAIATIATQSVVTVFQWINVYKLLNITIHFKGVVQFTSFVGLLYVVGYYSLFLSPGIWFFPVFILVILFLFKAIDLKPLIGTLKS